MRALITGITGFVGRYLEYELKQKGFEVFGTSRSVINRKKVFQVDMLEKGKLFNLLKEIKPTHIFHLAGMSNVRESWLNITKTIETNIIGTTNLLEAVYKYDKSVRVITIGSSEEYGKVCNNGKKISEDTPLNPVSPYGLSKAAISMLIKQFQIGYGLDIIHIRPFNHIGPGQGLGFVTSDFTNQIVKINSGKLRGNVMKVGNLEAVRDFTDVRDIVKAYYLIALDGKAGEVYNVCCGKGTKIKEILDTLLSFSEIEIKVKIDPKKERLLETPYYVGDYTKLNQLTAWEPIIPLHQSLQEIYNNWSEM